MFGQKQEGCIAIDNLFIYVFCSSVKALDFKLNGGLKIKHSYLLNMLVFSPPEVLFTTRGAVNKYIVFQHSFHKYIFITNTVGRLSNGIRFIAKKDCYNKEVIMKTQISSLLCKVYINTHAQFVHQANSYWSNEGENDFEWLFSSLLVSHFEDTWKKTPSRS